MLITILVIAHSAFLRQFPGAFQRNAQHPVFPHIPGKNTKFHRIHGLAYIPAAGCGNMGDNAFLREDGSPPLFLQKMERPFHSWFHILRLYRLKFEHSRTAQNGRIHIKIGVFCGGSNQSDTPVLNEFQKSLLLLFIEILNLIQIQHHPLRCQQSPHIRGDGLDVRQRGGGGVQAVERPVHLGGGDLRHRGLSRAGGTVKNQIGIFPP